MQESNSLKKLLEIIKQKHGGDLSTPKGFLCLSLDINERCGKSISVATIKRLFGYVKYENRPSVRILNIFASYVGYKSYAEFCDNYMDNIEFPLSLCGMYVQIGDIVNVTIPTANVTIRLQYKGNCTFRMLDVSSLK
ncbi:MAG: hypothetical protein RR880_00270 [Bacteroidales bacterium]